jgi:hypothetical protein
MITRGLCNDCGDYGDGYTEEFAFTCLDCATQAMWREFEEIVYERPEDYLPRIEDVIEQGKEAK